jgi:hypothetical protein
MRLDPFSIGEILYCFAVNRANGSDDNGYYREQNRVLAPACESP